MTIPDRHQGQIKRQRLWNEADRLGWSALSAKDKASITRCGPRPQIGGRLAGFMDPRKVRVYIKDTLLKPYMRERLSERKPVFRYLDWRPRHRSVQATSSRMGADWSMDGRLPGVGD